MEVSSPDVAHLAYNALKLSNNKQKKIYMEVLWGFFFGVLFFECKGRDESANMNVC